NQSAVDAILKDLPRRVSVDPPRLYLAGFSGTSRVAWIFGLALRGNVAGIIGCGAGLPDSGPGLQEDLPFAYFATAGTTDFNYQEMVQLDRELEKLGTAHRWTPFDGAHQWMPPEVAREALAWMRLEAMARGLETPKEAWIEAQFQAGWKEAEALEAQGDLVTAQRRFQGLAEDHERFQDVTRAKERAEALARRPEVREALSRQEKLARQEATQQNRLHRWFEKWMTTELIAAPGRALVELDVPNLQKLTEDEDPEVARSAQRRLTHTFVQLHATLAPRFERGGNHEREAALLEIARAIHPDHPIVRFKLAKAYTAWGRYETAFELLQGLVDDQLIRRQTLEEDPDLEPLRQRKEWGALMESLETAYASTAEEPHA
ncbi:MAG: hypothetical protein KDD47_27485, partial [Acidobacteria bacterium]|nr:hypothetical protein [Acidobacteriota bacterium]